MPVPWKDITILRLTLPGSSYRYLPILAQSSIVTWLNLTFTSPPIFPTDNQTQRRPVGYKGRRGISLPSLRIFAVTFLNNSFTYAPSWKFFDAIKASSKVLTEVRFDSDHFSKRPVVEVGPEAYGPFYNFLSDYAHNLDTFYSTIGPGMGVDTLLECMTVKRKFIPQLELKLHRPDPRYPLVHPEESLSTLLETINRRFNYIEQLYLTHPISYQSSTVEFSALENSVRDRIRRGQMDGLMLTIVDSDIVFKNTLPTGHEVKTKAVDKKWKLGVSRFLEFEASSSS